MTITDDDNAARINAALRTGLADVYCANASGTTVTIAFPQVDDAVSSIARSLPHAVFSSRTYRQWICRADTDAEAASIVSGCIAIATRLRAVEAVETLRSECGIAIGVLESVASHVRRVVESTVHAERLADAAADAERVAADARRAEISAADRPDAEIASIAAARSERIAIDATRSERIARVGVHAERAASAACAALAVVHAERVDVAAAHAERATSAAVIAEMRYRACAGT